MHFVDISRTLAVIVELRVFRCLCIKIFPLLLSALLNDGRRRSKHVARFLTFEPFVLMVETKLNKGALKTEVNVRV
jgi:hypothetical protein